MQSNAGTHPITGQSVVARLVGRSVSTFRSTATAPLKPGEVPVCIPPELMYAYERTGFMLTEDGYKNLSVEDRAEYDAAIAEFRARGKKR